LIVIFSWTSGWLKESPGWDSKNVIKKIITFCGRKLNSSAKNIQHFVLLKQEVFQ
jgi:hypothetical protein